VRQYLSTLPKTSAYSNATSNVPMDHEESTAVPQVLCMVAPNQRTAPSSTAYASSGIRPCVLKPTATPFAPLYAQTAMLTFFTPFYPAVDQRGITQEIAESF